ncbi:Ach1p [Sugiyamaella lignohabitans]|uniref:Acetyl-CoA hydrolase n=1 Tax=Sugiyamaella lignohabitans TaxID=796027 RepID=A0A167FID8_9ASCO|nr:Ach1p [Sugiyamaella lignohabitans]ANB15336.1 Ach1p [Sugiyamaella lignohabitans]
MSALLKSRIRNKALLSKLRSPEELIPYFKNGQYLGWSGFTGVGGPKVVPKALAKHVEANNLQGKLGFNLFVGASADVDIESKWAELGMLLRRSPHQVGKPIEKSINAGKTHFFDKHLSMWPQDLTYGYYTRFKENDLLDISIIEATAITEDGGVILGPSVGGTPELVSTSEKVIIELNTALPSFEGLHDINMPVAPPYREPYPVTTVKDRFGTSALPIDPSKILAIVESDAKDTVPENTPSDAMSRAIADHLVEFFQHEVKLGRMPENLHPLQSGIGNIANAVVEGLADASFTNLNVWTEVLQDSFLDFFESGKLEFATATSIRLTPGGFKRFFSNWDTFSKQLLLRSQAISNHPELIRRLGVIAMNTPVEVDIYGHANSTNVSGSRMLHGIGGSGDFLRNAKLSIMHTPSARATKTDPFGLSTVIPFATHVDHTEHDLDILVTEQGLADLRGLSPRERSREIVKKCAHPVYQPILNEYLDRAEFAMAKKKALHEPHILRDAFKLHLNLEEKGTMRIDSWE